MQNLINISDFLQHLSLYVDLQNFDFEQHKIPLI
jgi:hypothetical protein